jgi:hypothetical protein
MKSIHLQVGRVFASLAASLPSSLTADGGMAELEPLVSTKRRFHAWAGICLKHPYLL